MTAHAAAYVNRPAYLLIRRYGDIVLNKLGAGAVSLQNDELRQQKIAALERSKLLETRVEERIRIQAAIDDLRHDLKNFD
jgi:hypothetical protein